MKYLKREREGERKVDILRQEKKRSKTNLNPK